MKNLTKITLLLLLAFTNCKKEDTLTECLPAPKAETYEWTLTDAEHVTRKASDNTITSRTPVSSYLFNYDHKLKDGVYYQSPIDSNNYTVAGSYSGTTFTFDIGGGVDYYLSYEEDKLILERILYSNDTITYVTERNTFTPKK